VRPSCTCLALLLAKMVWLICSFRIHKQMLAIASQAYVVKGVLARSGPEIFSQQMNEGKELCCFCILLTEAKVVLKSLRDTCSRLHRQNVKRSQGVNQSSAPPLKAVLMSCVPPSWLPIMHKQLCQQQRCCSSVIMAYTDNLQQFCWCCSAGPPSSNRLCLVRRCRIL